MLRLQTLGGLSVQGAVEPNGAAAQRRNLVLLALVAASAGGISRDKLLGYLSPELSEDRARNTLRQRIYALRHGLGADDLFRGTTDLRLNPAVVSVDLWDFEAALAAGDAARATGVYGGPFLDGIFLEELPELESWIEDRRAERRCHERSAGICE
jgi:DNA-binding SARP family transcriptional activator